MKASWKLLIIQLVCVFLIPIVVGFIVGFWYGLRGFELSERQLEDMILMVSLVLLVFAAWMIYIFYKEAKKYSKNAPVQSVIFGISLIPLILLMNWFIALPAGSLCSS